MVSGDTAGKQPCSANLCFVQVCGFKRN